MKRFKNILFVADGAIEAGPALQRAVALARTNDARLTVIDVVEEQQSSTEIESDFGSDLNSILKEHRRQALERMVEPFNEPDDIIYMRSSEMYLIEAEAYAMLNNIPAAQAAD